MNPRAADVMTAEFTGADQGQIFAPGATIGIVTPSNPCRAKSRSADFRIRSGVEARAVDLSARFRDADLATAPAGEVRRLDIGRGIHNST